MSARCVIVGNLDAESRLRPSGGGPLPRALLGKLSAAATLLRAFACDDDDVLWTPLPLDAARMLDVEGLPRPRLVSGELAECAGDDVEWFPWAITEDVARVTTKHRREAPVGGMAGETAGAAGRGMSPDADGRASLPLHERCRRAARCDAAIARAVTDRRWSAALVADLGLALPGARTIGSIADLRAHLAHGGADGSPTREWVLKDPFSAAGRGHVIGDASWLDDTERLAALDRTLRRTGPWCFEPWLRRTRDLGCCAIVVPQGVELLGVHELENDARGRFRGVRWGVDGAPPSLDADVVARLCEVTTEVGRALSRDGYAGPFAVDAFTYVDADGRERLHPLAEVNPRLSFGFVARALGERFVAARGGSAPHEFTLRFGAAPTPPGVLSIPLLAPSASASERTRARLESRSPATTVPRR